MLASFSLDPVLMHHFGKAELLDDSVERLQRMDGHWRDLGYGFMAAVRKADGEIVGNCGLKPITLAPEYLPHARPDDIEIGWLFRQDCWGKGFAFEAASAVLEWGLKLAPRAIAITAVSNAPSWGLMQRLGMQRLDGWDFEHPDVAQGHFAKPHLVYGAERK